MMNAAVSKLHGGLFQKIIGQKGPIKKAKFLLDGYIYSRKLPNTLITGGIGQGKSTMAKEIAKGLVLFDDKGEVVINPENGRPKRKKLVEIVASTLSTVNNFINDTFIPDIQDKDVTVFIDEASEIPHSIEMMFLPILQIPEGHTKTFLDHRGYVCEFDFLRQSFIFATSEPHLIFPALKDRCKRIELQEYSSDELALIVQRHSPGVSIPNDILLDISSLCRGNARNAKDIGEDIISYLKGEPKLTWKGWEQLKDTLDIFPLGLTPMEIQILRVLAETPSGISLTRLSAKTGITRDALQKDYELFLQKRNLMTIDIGGRIITPQGLNYLRAMFGQATRTEPNMQVFHSDNVEGI